MTRNLILLLTLALAICSCRDEFNDPNPDYEEIIDLIAPEIELLSLKADSVYHNIDTLPIQIRYTDDHLLELMKFDLVVLNGTANPMNLLINKEDTVFLLDTFYPLPALDTVELGILTTCKDYAENTAVESFNIQVVR
ncbi:MAG: hypothetical protein JXR19_09020 [Bacteroidia bacterium]